jgi:hypothetical protein
MLNEQLDRAELRRAEARRDVDEQKKVIREYEQGGRETAPANDVLAAIEAMVRMYEAECADLRGATSVLSSS